MTTLQELDSALGRLTRKYFRIFPSCVLANKGSDPIGVIATVGEQHCSRLQATQESSGEPVIMRLASRQCEPDR